MPLPPPLPPTSPEANLAEIVKRRHSSLPLSIAGSLDVMDIKTTVNVNEGKPLSPNATVSSKPVPHATQIHKTDTKVRKDCVLFRAKTNVEIIHAIFCLL